MAGLGTRKSKKNKWKNDGKKEIKSVHGRIQKLALSKEQESSFHFVTRQKTRRPFSILKFILKCLFSNVGLSLLILFMTWAGAFVLRKIELPIEEERYERKMLESKKIADTITYLCERVNKLAEGEDIYLGKGRGWELYKPSEQEFYDKVGDDLHAFVRMILKAVKNHRYDGEVDSYKYDWTMANSLMVTASVMTTIGYGNIVPVSNLGFCWMISYGVLSVSMFLLYLTKCGKAMAVSFRYVYSRMCCRVFRIARKESETPNIYMRIRQKNRVIDDFIGQESWLRTNRVKIPLVLGMAVICAYVYLGAYVFKCWEGWNYIDGVYFCVITITTIGLGDFIPEKSLHFETLSGGLKVIFTMIYIITGILSTRVVYLNREQRLLVYTLAERGMTLISMTVSLGQEQIRNQAEKQRKKGEQEEIEVVQIVPRDPFFARKRL